MKIMYITRDISVGGVTKCIYNLCKNQTFSGHAIICASGEALKEDFLGLNVDFFAISDVERRNPIILLKVLMIIKSLIKREQITLIHSHHRMTTLLAKLAAVGTEAKVVHTQHLNIQDKFYFTRIALSKIPTICVSQAAKKILVDKSGLDCENICTIYNAIDEETDYGEIDPQLVASKTNSFFTVAQISRLVEYKGVFEFLEIAKKVSKHTDRIKFFLIGDGPEKKKLLCKIKEQGLVGTVFLLGNKSNVLKQLEAVDLMMLCSKIEGLPLAPIEAFYSGIPVIGSDIDGTREEVKNGKNGYLIPQNQLDEFAEKILYLSKNPKVYQQMKLSAKRTFKDKFTTDKYILNHQKFYQQVIKDTSANS
ncbi:glycosyltransferase family 4 protein [Enterococcus faecalis]|nr:glycosyltransferase family 4 protein [Enterococcus faecalis]